MNKKNKKNNAAIIIIGNEILSGRTQDKNVSILTNWLNELGIKVAEVRIIPDLEDIIVEAVNKLKKNFTYIFTTGGIGPTHDDITAKSISKAFRVKYEVNKEAYDILQKFYKPENFTDGRKKMTMMPSKSNIIKNPTSGAPGFFIDNVYCLPGVPSILKSMLGGLSNEIIGGKPIISSTVNLSTVESEIAKPLEQIQISNKDVEIGSYPFFRVGKIGVSIVMRSLNKTKIEICKKKILELAKNKKINVINFN